MDFRKNEGAIDYQYYFFDVFYFGIGMGIPAYQFQCRQVFFDSRILGCEEISDF